MNYDMNKIIKAARSGEMNKVMENLNQKDAAKINELLKDNEKLKEILNSEQAKAIMERLKNG
ncbi:MAG: hypothetical protein E7568_03220 [Ruminococcaceae bacterium]|nr:hypothetical protein [Oscillospiraceae bacterium]